MNPVPRFFHFGIAIIPAILFLVVGETHTREDRPLSEDDQRTIVLDPGHGGQEPGARGPDGTLEKAVALALARMIATELEPEHKVILTRSDDYRVDLVKRTAMANHLKADLFISIHTGGSYVHSTAGTSIYYYQSPMGASPSQGEVIPLPDDNEKNPVLWNHVQDDYTQKSQKLARLLSLRLGEMDSAKQIRTQGAPLAVLQSAGMAAVLIEVGYLTNPVDEKNLRDERFLRRLALQIRRGIEDFFSREQP